MILLRCDHVCDYKSYAIAKHIDTGKFEVYARHGFVAGDFNSIDDAKKFIDKGE